MTEPQDQSVVDTAADPAAQTPGTDTGAGNASAQSAGNLFPNLADSGIADSGNRDMTMLMDIPVQLTVELGRKRVPIKHVLQMAQGSVIELNSSSGEPMDVLGNGCLIAQGEVVIVNDKFGVRLTEIVTPAERIRRLNRG